MRNWKPSVTVAAVIEHQGKFLLVEEMTHAGPRLNQPAGHLELGESPLQACVREVREETAREFTPQAFLGVYLGRFQRPLQSAPLTAPLITLDLTYTPNRNTAIANNNKGDQPVTTEDITYVRLAFSGTVGHELPGLAYDKEILRTTWMSYAEIAAVPEQHRSPMVLLCLQDYLAGRRLPLDTVRTHESVWAASGL